MDGFARFDWGQVFAMAAEAVPDHETEGAGARPDTRRRVLSAAGEIFAERGFREATVREICERAGANIAAVNYHFRDKEGLYRAVFQDANVAAMERYPVERAGERGADSSAAPAEQLRGYVRNFIARLLDDDGRPSWHGQLMAREMVEPTAVLDEQARDFVRPQFERLCAIVRLLLGAGASEDAIVRSACSVAGQCLFYKHARPMIERAMPEVRFDAAARVELGEHIAEFSLRAMTVAGAAGASGKGAGA